MDSSSTSPVVSSLKSGKGSLIGTRAGADWTVLIPVLLVFALLTGCINSRVVSRQTSIAPQAEFGTPTGQALSTRVSYPPHAAKE